MSGGAPFPAQGGDLLVWIAVTLLLGGPAAWASGRALARAWRPFGRGVLYAVLLAAVADFLCYALFQLSVLPLYRLGAAISAGDVPAVLSTLTGFGATAALLIVIAYVGWTNSRAKLMRAQYPFLGEPSP